MTLLLALGLAFARPPTGERQVVVVLKSTDCTVCAAQLKRLARAGFDASVFGLTQDSASGAAKVSAATGVPTYSHARGVQALGLVIDERTARPAVVVYDRCGAEIGRVVGRAPGSDATPAVRQLLEQADDAHCKAPEKPQS